MTRSHALIFLHHLLLAAVISSAALLFELTVLYKKLDFYTLYWMGSSKHEADMDPDAQRLRARQSVVDNKNKPRVLLINDLVW